VEIKIGGNTLFENLLKTIIPFALVGYEVIITNSSLLVILSLHIQLGHME